MRQEVRHMGGRGESFGSGDRFPLFPVFCFVSAGWATFLHQRHDVYPCVCVTTGSTDRRKTVSLGCEGILKKILFPHVKIGEYLRCHWLQGEIKKRHETS